MIWNAVVTSIIALVLDLMNFAFFTSVFVCCGPRLTIASTRGFARGLTLIAAGSLDVGLFCFCLELA